MIHAQEPDRYPEGHNPDTSGDGCCFLPGARRLDATPPSTGYEQPHREQPSEGDSHGSDRRSYDW